MSKRNSSVSGSPGGNTLFKYFAKSPAPASKTPARAVPVPSPTPNVSVLKNKAEATNGKRFEKGKQLKYLYYKCLKWV